MQPSSGFSFAQEQYFGTNPVWDCLLSRRSIRIYRDEPISVAVVNQLLAIATQAPSAHNRQPWRWVVVANPTTRHTLAEAMAVDFARDLERDGVDDATIEKTVNRSRERIGGAPMVVVPCVNMAEMDHYPDPTRQHCEWQMAVQSVALASQNLMLAAHAIGMGSCWICAPIFCAPTVQQALTLPPEWEPQALITLGYPAAPGRTRPRKGVEEITLYR
jgi:coenzyme F420-0:L-glutamate ligase/coenzyme F420-1:gamma-L-glutamate ligase